MATIRDVARQAGVSTATVSRVVSNRGYVSPDTRVRVLRAVEELQYVPNAMARGLKTARSGLIALLVPEIVYSFYTTICRGVEDVTSGNGFHVILGNTDEDVAKEKAYLDLMLANQVDGLVLASAGHSARHLKALSSQHVPTVLVDRSLAGFPADVVRNDNVGGATAMTRHLLSLGHRRIAFVNGDVGTSVAREREAGFRRALQDAGVALDDELVSRGTWFGADADARVARLLESGRPFSAIFAANYLLVVGALRALRRCGRRVPEDVALVCFDDIDVVAEIDPFLTVVAQPAYMMGTLAAQFVLDRIGGKYAGPPRELVVSPRLVIRRSCGTPPGSATAAAEPMPIQGERAAPDVDRSAGASAGATRHHTGWGSERG